MPVPRVAIVGRPNVGKSSLFNWLAGRRIAIVDPTAGVTRDRIIAPIPTDAGTVELIDTGGMGNQDVDGLSADVERQIQAAIHQADLVLFVVDVRDGIVPLDQMVAERLRGLGKPVFCVVNKCDYPDLEAQAAEFHRFGFPLVIVSAQQKLNKEQLLKLITTSVQQTPASAAMAEPVLKLAIVGRRNTGKSTFINSLAQEERTIVSEVPGTTRDSIDIHFELDGKTILAIDTAGVRKKKSLTSSVEFYSLARAERSIRRADVVLLFFDPRWKVSRVDKQLAGYIIEQHKPAIFVVNKWDLAVGTVMTGAFGDYLHKMFPSLGYVPIAFITAKEGKNVQMVLNLARTLQKQSLARVDTGELNRVLRHAIEMQQPPLRQNRRPKIYFATQVDVAPPTIVLMTNGPELFDDPYRRYLLNTFRDQLPFHEIPIKLHLRNKRKRVKNERELDASDEVEVTQPPPEPAPKRPRKRSTPPAPELWTDI